MMGHVVGSRHYLVVIVDVEVDLSVQLKLGRGGSR